jgi:hypothetical protein
MMCSTCGAQPACPRSKKFPGLCFACRPAPAKVCRHCRRSAVSRPRGLCWGCYYAPGVKDLYPPNSKFAKNHERREPTEAELDALIAEQMANLPEWWDDEKCRGRDRRDFLSDE